MGSKISKMKLLTGIHTKGLSVKYPELERYARRQIIFIDSTGFENPILNQFNRKEQKNEIILKEKAKARYD